MRGFLYRNESLENESGVRLVNRRVGFKNSSWKSGNEAS